MRKSPSYISSSHKVMRLLHHLFIVIHPTSYLYMSFFIHSCTHTSFPIYLFCIELVDYLFTYSYIVHSLLCHVFIHNLSLMWSAFKPFKSISEFMKHQLDILWLIGHKHAFRWTHEHRDGTDLISDMYSLYVSIGLIPTEITAEQISENPDRVSDPVTNGKVWKWICI